MAFELVTPPKKGNQPAQFFAPFNVSTQPTLAADGNRLLFISSAALAGTPAVYNPTGDTYIATRTPSGWETAPTAPPVAYKDALGNPSVFSPALDRWLDFLSTPAQYSRGQFGLQEGELGQGWSAQSGVLAALFGAHDERDIPKAASNILGSSPGLTELVFRAGSLDATLLPADPVPNGGSAAGNAYLLSGIGDGSSDLELLARDKAGVVWGGTCGAWLGGGELSGSRGGRNQGAISADGTRMIFSTRPNQPSHEVGAPSLPSCQISGNPIRILRRTTTPGGIEISEVLPGGAAPSQGDDNFEGASQDGSRIVLSTPRQLVAGDTDEASACSPVSGVMGCDLYMYDDNLPEGERVRQLSAGAVTTGHPVAGKEAGVIQGATAISADASRVYFVALAPLINGANPLFKGASPLVRGTGQLTSGSTEVTGATTTKGKYSVGQLISAVGIPNGTRIEAVVGGKLTLSAPASSTGSANLIAGEPNLYVYRSDEIEPGGGLRFIGTLSSKDAGLSYGVQQTASDAEAVPAAAAFGGGGELGETLVFQTAASLSSEDADGGHRDIYRYEDGEEPTLSCVSCLPGEVGDSAPFDVSVRVFPQIRQAQRAETNRWVSEDGEVVLFGTPQPLAVGDVDGVENPYIWRAGAAGGLFRLPAIRTSLAAPLQATVSRDGREVAFETALALVPQDQDVTDDVYVARADGGITLPSQTPQCQGEACRPAPVAAPPPPLAGSALYLGAGNQPPERKPPKKKKKKAKKNQGKKGAAGKKRANGNGHRGVDRKLHGEGGVR